MGFHKAESALHLWMAAQEKGFRRGIVYLDRNMYMI